jgi:hypothetical protein
MNKVPTYADGCFDLYRVQEDTSEDFPKEVLIDQGMRIFYNELAIYDRLRFELSQGGKEVTMKIRIPQYRGIDSHCYAKINGIMHQCYNVAHITTDGRFQETEITLIAPEHNIEVLE